MINSDKLMLIVYLYSYVGNVNFFRLNLISYTAEILHTGPQFLNHICLCILYKSVKVVII